MDYNQIISGLYVGSAPDPGHYQDRFNTIVLCAQEYQIPSDKLTVAEVLYCPLPDAEITKSQLFMAEVTAERIALRVLRSRKVLVTCMAGINRSAFVAGLAMKALGFGGRLILEKLRERRFEYCVSNECFEKILLDFSTLGCRTDLPR